MGSQNQVLESFNNAAGVALSKGMIVRGTTGVRQTLLAQADSLANLASVLGVANNQTGPTGLYFAVVAGEAEVLLETGLTPVGGQTVYVSASVAGRGTTAAPLLGVEVGTIIDASQYSNTGRVMVSLAAFFDTSDSPPANWPLADARYFFVDNENGNDANVGYIDAAPGTVFAAGAGAAVALKTAEELRNRIPRVGASRILVVLFKPRSDNGNYLNKAGASDFIDFNYDGYLTPIFRASNDFTNSTNDQYDSGGVVDAVGPNADGSWTVSSQVSFVITVAAGALPVENTLTGNKLQFKGNVTAGARASGQTVIARTAATVFDTGQAQTLANGDEFFFMTPGVKFTTIRGVAGRGGMVTGQTVPRNIQAIGFRFTAAVSIYEQMPIRFEFCRFDAALGINAGTAQSIATNWRNESETNINMRCGIDCRSTFNFQGNVASINMCAFHSTSSFTNISSDGSINTSYYNGLPSINGVGKTSGSSGGFGFVFGGFTGSRPSRFAAGISVGQSKLLFQFIDLAGSTAGITVGGGHSDISLTDISGAVAAGVNIISVTSASLCRLNIGTITATTSGGGFEILLAGSVGTTFAGLATTNVVDNAGNDIQGPAGRVVDSCILVSNQTGGSPLIGSIMKGNGTTGQVVSAFADALANAEIEGVLVTPPGVGANAYMVAAGTPVCNFDAAPTPGAIAYLSVTTTGQLTTTIPPAAATNQKLRAGRVVSVNGTTARVAWHPENLAVVADGNA